MNIRSPRPGAAGLLIGSAGTGRVWSHSAIVGAHIAELRRDALAEA